MVQSVKQYEFLYRATLMAVDQVGQGTRARQRCCSRPAFDCRCITERNRDLYLFPEQYIRDAERIEALPPSMTKIPSRPKDLLTSAPTKPEQSLLPKPQRRSSRRPNQRAPARCFPEYNEVGLAGHFSRLFLEHAFSVRHALRLLKGGAACLH